MARASNTAGPLSKAGLLRQWRWDLVRNATPLMIFVGTITGEKLLVLVKTLYLHIKTNNSNLSTENTLLKKMVEAIPEAISHHRAFVAFNEHLHADREDQVKQWEVEYDAWVKKPKGSPCIFDTSEPGRL
jgi:hypothetical protein